MGRRLPPAPLRLLPLPSPVRPPLLRLQRPPQNPLHTHPPLLDTPTPHHETNHPLHVKWLYPTLCPAGTAGVVAPTGVDGCGVDGGVARGVVERLYYADGVGVCVGTVGGVGGGDGNWNV